MWILKWVPKNNLVKGPALILLVVLLIYPYGRAVFLADFCLHKKQVVIEQTTCEGFASNYDNGYYTESDYLNFSIDVSFKREEVSHFVTHTLVFNEDKFIGYLASEFYLESFEPNASQKFYFHISNPANTYGDEDNPLRELFYKDLDNFEFVTNIICTYFVDGTMVGHYLFFPNDFYYDENGTIYYKDQFSDKTRYYYYDDNGRKHYVKG